MAQMKPVTITLTGEQVEALGEALDLAHGDQEHYCTYGNPATDYDEEWPEVAQHKAATFRLLGEVGEAIGFRGERDRWNGLAENMLASGNEFQNPEAGN